MRSLVYSITDFMPLGPKAYHLKWGSSADIPSREWRIRDMVDYGYNTFSTVIQRSCPEVAIYAISIELDDGIIGFDRGDPASVPIEKALLKNSYIYNAAGSLKNLDGMSFREFYSSEASCNEYLFSIEFISTPCNELAQNVASYIYDGDIENLGREISKIKRLTLWPRSRELGYLVSSRTNLVLEELRSILNTAGCKIKELHMSDIVQ